MLTSRTEQKKKKPKPNMNESIHIVQSILFQYILITVENSIDVIQKWDGEAKGTTCNNWTLQKKTDDFVKNKEIVFMIALRNTYTR